MFVPTIARTNHLIKQQNGDAIIGEISVAPNAKNNRDLDIVIEYSVTGSASDNKKERIEYRMCVVVNISNTVNSFH